MAAHASLPPSRASRRTVHLVTTEPEDSARVAGLRYAMDDRPGIERRKVGKGFRYVDPNGHVVRDAETLARIRSLAIPPAWTQVWVAPQPNAHLQATGRDARGRKQYRYHPRWRVARDETKYHRMLPFAAALPRIRARVDADLAQTGLPREKVLATVVRLLETTLIRIGNEEYARTNHSFGLTTMRDRHVEISGSTIVFRFRGKSGKDHEIDVRDRHLASIVRKMAELPGHELFHYLDESGAPHTVESDDVNAYLREVSGEAFTAKDFRTWAGTVLAAVALRDLPLASPPEAKAEAKASATAHPVSTRTVSARPVSARMSHACAKRDILRAIQSVSRRLGNTAAVCRKCYVHPAVLDGYIDGHLLDALGRATTATATAEHPHALRSDEAAVVGFLRERLARGDAAPSGGRARTAPRMARGLHM